jgi:hypothetical protein
MLFFMQHYGVPTRLLDWTENPFIALFFAVTSCPLSRNVKGGVTSLSFPTDAAVWILDPAAWNEHALRHQGFHGGILAGSDDALQGYKPMTRFADMNVNPVALYGAHNSPRIVAQRGAFTIAGQGLRGMEQEFDSEGFPKTSLIKVVLGKTVLEGIRKSVFQYGMTESTVFPDLGGLAAEIKREFNFEF